MASERASEAYPSWQPARRRARADLAEQFAALGALGELKPGWDSYEAPPPSGLALDHARRVLEALMDWGGSPPVRVVPSVEGAVVLAFSNGARYADIECFNDGEILAVISAPEGDPMIWSVELDPRSLQAAIERIAAFLNP